MAAVAATCEAQSDLILLARLCITDVSLDVPRTSELTCEMNLYLRCDLPDVSCAEAAASCFFSCICCTCRSAQHMPSASARLANGPTKHCMPTEMRRKYCLLPAAEKTPTKSYKETIAPDVPHVHMVTAVILNKR